MNEAILEAPMAAALRVQGYKLTVPRLAVLQVLADGGQLLSPAEIYQRGKEVYPALGLTTVYRTLEILTNLGFLRRTYVGDHQQRYATHSGGHNHHLICRQCGRVLDVAQCNLADLVEDLQTQTQFRIDGHYVEFYGICPNCSRHGRSQA